MAGTSVHGPKGDATFASWTRVNWSLSCRVVASLLAARLVLVAAELFVMDETADSPPKSSLTGTKSPDRLRDLLLGALLLGVSSGVLSSIINNF